MKDEEKENENPVEGDTPAQGDSPETSGVEAETETPGDDVTAETDDPPKEGGEEEYGMRILLFTQVIC